METIYRILYTAALEYLRTNCKCGVDNFDHTAHDTTCQFRTNIESGEKDTMRGVPDADGASGRLAQIEAFTTAPFALLAAHEQRITALETP